MEKYVQLYFFFEVLNVSLDTAVSCIKGESGGRPTKQLRAETRVTGSPVFRGLSQSLKENRDKS